MIGENQVRGFAQEQVAVDFYAELAQTLDFIDKANRVNHHAVADDAGLFGAQNAGRN